MANKSVIIEEYSNGIILPRKEVNNGPMWGLGGVCDADNSFVNSSYYDGGWATHGGKYDWQEEDNLDCEAVYFGLFFCHWGHFLIDLTTRMWALPKFADSDVKIAYIGEEEPQANHIRYFELLGIKKEQLIHITKPTRFKKIYVPQQGFKSCEWYSNEYVTSLDYMVQNALNGDDDFSKLKDIDNVYFSRRSFAKAVSSEFGEDYFERCFTSNGYTAVAPETLSLDEQIYIWNNAKSIVCMNGTIPLNVLFSQNKELDLTVLNKMSIFHENPIILLKMREIDARFVDIYKEPLKKYPKSLGEGPYLLWSTSDFEAFCNEKNLKNPFSMAETKKYFSAQQRKYYWYIIGIKRKLRLFLSKIIPQGIKNIIRR